MTEPVYHITLWVRTDDPMKFRERILDLADMMQVEIDYSDPIEEEHEMPNDMEGV